MTERNVKDRLLRIRARAQLKWGEIAKRLQISTSMISQVLCGRRAFGDLAMARLARLESELGVLEFFPAAENDLNALQRDFLGLLCCGLEKENGRGVRLAVHHIALPAKITSEILNQCPSPDGLNVIHIFRPQAEGVLPVLIEYPTGKLDYLTLQRPPAVEFVIV